MKTIILAFIISLSVSYAWTAEIFDDQMTNIAEKYLLIQEKLASDKTDLVKNLALEINSMAAELAQIEIPAEHKEHYQNLADKLQSAAQNLSNSKNIKKMREAFAELSKPMAMWAGMYQPEGINVVFCSMAPGSWLQRGEDIQNPYFGKSMLRCGEIISRGKTPAAPIENEHHQMHH